MNTIHAKYSTAETLIIGEGITQKVLLVGSETDGKLSMYEDIVQPGAGVPRHIHKEQDETFIFLEGTFDVEIDGKVFTMQTGDTAVIPMGAVHAWKNVGDGVGRLRYIYTPARNLENMFRAFNDAIVSNTLTPEKAMEITSQYPSQQLAGPPM